MAAIRSLLNPAPEIDKCSESEPEPLPTTEQHNVSQGKSSQSRKKQKIGKDAAVFTRGPIRGECRYPPHEYQDDLLAAQHQHFDVYPMGEIADYPRHIPYNSEKKFFFEKTGRESLEGTNVVCSRDDWLTTEVFQYNFRVPGDDTQFAMLWDYNIGLVRTTPLFKCTGHSKTTPAKMLNRNPGLRAICHSITGGALVAQGYWMPFEAAKAVAATFCWKIRYALTPVFGTDFPATCIHPDSDKFGDMVIDPAIVRRCTEMSEVYRALESRSTSRPMSTTPTPLTPDTPTYPRHIKQYPYKGLKIDTCASPSDTGSEYNNSGASTPEPQFRSMWTPANTPRSAPYFHTQNFVSPQKHHTISKSSSNLSSPECLPKSRYTKAVDDEDYDGVSSDESFVQNVPAVSRKASVGLPSDEKAAYLLMSLKLQIGRQQECRGKKRRAST